jgi:hypothetical protein
LLKLKTTAQTGARYGVVGVVGVTGVVTTVGVTGVVDFVTVMPLTNARKPTGMAIQNEIKRKQKMQATTYPSQPICCR